ncbi:hypothetical protein GCM10011504_51230 [Siccirubricoccus deserti]|nr:hypothetical protein GCM10011504_51230 [Siccirubricoccus deserti]
MVVPEPPKRSSTGFALLAAVADGALDQRHRLHRGMQVIPCRLVEVPDMPLVAGTAPVVLYTGLTFPLPGIHL